MKQKVQQDLKTAMLSKDKETVATLRALLTAFTNFEKSVDGSIVTDADYVQIVRKQVKQRDESGRIYRENGRVDLMANEMAESSILEKYMPQVLTEDQVGILVAGIVIGNKIELVKKNMGQIVKLVVAEAAGQTDGKTVSSIVNKLIMAQTT